MNTPAHLLIGAGIFARPAHRRLVIAAVLGALAPDLSLYIMAGTSLYLLGIPPQEVFGRLYYSDAWQTVFAIDNSLLLWSLLLVFALWQRKTVLTVFAAAGLLHLGLDFPLHAGDGRAHFWPATNWVFDSPISYWDRRHHAAWIMPVAIVACLAALISLWKRGIGWPERVGFSLLMMSEIWVARQWLLFF